MIVLAASDGVGCGVRAVLCVWCCVCGVERGGSARGGMSMRKRKVKVGQDRGLKGILLESECMEECRVSLEFDLLFPWFLLR